MKIQVFSDLHFEAQNEFDLLETEAEVIVLAGDINEGLAGVNWAIRQAKLVNKPVLYVFGNHEHYKHSFPGLMTQARMMSLGTNVHILERNRYIHGNTRFLGCTLWTDYRLYGTDQARKCKEFARSNMLDYLIVTKQNGELLQPEDTLWIFEQSIRWLQRELDRPWNGKTVVVTHHAPSNLSTNPLHEEDILTAAFISNLDHIIKRHHIDAWVHGHTHFNVDFRIRETRIITHQSGYPSENLSGNQLSRKQVFKI